MFFLAANHARLAVDWYHKFGNVDPYLSVLISNLNFFDVIRFPFEILELLALIILFLMAVTSHDFWLKNLTTPVWKALHMCVYLAYGLFGGVRYFRSTYRSSADHDYRHRYGLDRWLTLIIKE